MVFAEKTMNMYKMSKQEYAKLINDLTKTSQKWQQLKWKLAKKQHFPEKLKLKKKDRTIRWSLRYALLKDYKMTFKTRLPQWFNRLSQVACIILTVWVTCTQTALRVRKNSCAVLIPLCKNNFKLPMCLSFLFSRPVTPLLVHCVIMLTPSLHCTDFVAQP